MGKHIPLRMCMACREMKPKQELIRVVYKDGDVITDETAKLQQRGAYVCRNAECAKLLRKKRGLERAFRNKVEDSAYDMIDSLVN